MEKYGKDFKELTRKEKIAHIWEYYRWHILGTIFGGMILISFLVTMFTPREVDDVDVFIAGKLAYDATHSEVTAFYKEQFNAGLDVSIVDWESMGEMEMVMRQKIPLLITTDELDILGLSPNAFDGYVKQLATDMFVPLDTIPEASGLLEKYSDRLVSSNMTLNDEGELVETEEHVYGIRVNSFENISSIIGNEEFVLGITCKVKDLEKAIEVLDYLLEEDDEP